MVRIIQRERKGQLHYYLVYSYREQGRTKHRELYLGPKGPPPNELDEIKDHFVSSIIEERWLPSIQAIQVAYANRLNSSPPMASAEEMRAFGIRFTHNTNRIEGSSLNFTNVADILEHKMTPRNKPVDDVIEARAHMTLYEMMVQCHQEVTLNLMTQWHLLLFQNTKPDIAGKIRQRPIRIAGSKHVPPASEIEVKLALDDLLKWCQAKKGSFHPTMVAATVHFRVASIHPFYDGNGRMSRLLMNYILHRNGLPMFDIDYRIRLGYYHALERSNLNDNALHFLQWFYTHYIKVNRICLQDSD